MHVGRTLFQGELEIGWVAQRIRDAIEEAIDQIDLQADPQETPGDEPGREFAAEEHMGKLREKHG